MYAGTARADDTPGTTSKGIPHALSFSSSSPPRPNRNGSPPFRRTTFFPFFASSARILLIFSCGIGWCPAIFPTSISSLPIPYFKRIFFPTKWSYTSVSASKRISLAFTVRSPSSPGPAPTSQTLPSIYIPLTFIKTYYT